MKYTLLWNDTEAANERIAEWRKVGKSSDGITLIRADKRDIIDNTTGVFVQSANALRCKGSVFSLIAYKIGTGKAAWIGWGDK